MLLHQRLPKTNAGIVRHGRYAFFQMAGALARVVARHKAMFFTATG